jgi:hypothetical protein
MYKILVTLDLFSIIYNGGKLVSFIMGCVNRHCVSAGVDSEVARRLFGAIRRFSYADVHGACRHANILLRDRRGACSE